MYLKQVFKVSNIIASSCSTGCLSVITHGIFLSKRLLLQPFLFIQILESWHVFRFYSYNLFLPLCKENTLCKIGAPNIVFKQIQRLNTGQITIMLIYNDLNILFK